MNQYGPIYVTIVGLEKMKQELDYLTLTKREEVADMLELAIAHGDLSENADYDFAKQEQAFVEGRIKDLEDALRRAEVVETVAYGDSVGVGCTVTIFDEEWGDSETYRIVGVHEANPGEGLISNESPIGNALLGAKVGQTVVAATPGGEMRLRVEAIT